jgi:kanamycin kinase
MESSAPQYPHDQPGGCPIFGRGWAFRGGTIAGMTSEAAANGPVPDRVLALTGGRDLRLVWRNDFGGLTYEIVGAGQFIKWSADPRLDLTAESVRLRWAARYVSVPRVLDAGRDGREEWLLTKALPGQSAVSERWKADPATAAAAIGAGLRTLHDGLPVRDCPFSWSVEHRVAGKQFPAPPPIDRLVVCHGDSCAPNTIIDDDGECSGHVDFSEMGVADRWADLAIATWSTEWNYGPGWESTVLDAYGIAADPVRINYYRRLWEAT